MSSAVSGPQSTVKSSHAGTAISGDSRRAPSASGSWAGRSTYSSARRVAPSMASPTTSGPSGLSRLPSGQTSGPRRLSRPNALLAAHGVHDTGCEPASGKCSNLRSNTNMRTQLQVPSKDTKRLNTQAQSPPIMDATQVCAAMACSSRLQYPSLLSGAVHLGTIAQRQMRIRDRARRVVAAQLDATRSAQDVANLAERLARQDMAAAAAIANRDHQVAIGETPSPPPTPTTPLKLSAPPKNGAKPKSPAHAARRASGVEREATLDDSSLRRPPMIRVDSLTSVRTDT